MLKRFTIIAFLLTSSLVFMFGSTAHGEVDCQACHPDLSNKKTVHAAVQSGCATCHAGIDAADVPHKNTGKNKLGLSSESPELCYGCHDKGLFTKKNIHSAVSIGCSSCHSPHSTDTPKLLLSSVPSLCFKCHSKKKFAGQSVHPPVKDAMCLSCHNPHSSDTEKLLLSGASVLCFNCHDQKKFKGNVTHSPVAAGMCSSCHSPHASANASLLPGPVNEVCIKCHDKKEITSGLHVAPDIATQGHPVKGPKGPKTLGKEFTCISCHRSHSSESPKLSRFKAQMSVETCQYCHDK